MGMNAASENNTERPYPDGIAWDEALRQRQRADYLEAAIQEERDLSARRAHAAHLWSIARAALIDQGCPIQDGSHLPSVIGDWLHVKWGTNSMNERQAKVERLCRDATFHAIRGLNEINDQSQRLWSEFNTEGCKHHLRVAIEYLKQIDEVLAEPNG